MKEEYKSWCNQEKDAREKILKLTFEEIRQMLFDDEFMFLQIKDSKGFESGFSMGITCAKMIYQENQNNLKQKAERVMKADEKIACLNAAVLTDSRDNIVWLDNEKTLMMWKENE